MSVEADENLHDIIITEVKDGVLHIYSDKNIWSAKSRKVYVSALSINEISVTSGAEVLSENTITAEDFVVRATSGSEVKLDLNVTNLTCRTTSGSDARLKGKAVSFKASSTSGSDIKAQNLVAETCVASATSGSDIYVHVTDKLDAKATSGADIKYAGNPKMFKKTLILLAVLEVEAKKNPAQNSPESYQDGLDELFFHFFVRRERSFKTVLSFLFF